ncbi:hypothetical protein F4825DRAFT_46688 [Nemania diffusa]|nr:hypothetical protein F4825DRAFT_46688 [Nemania diffusa]
MEIYLLDDMPHGPEYRCLMASCPRSFKDPRSMLRHLKNCDFFSEGKFSCPTCSKIEDFKVVSKMKCSWGKVTLARKLFQKSWDVLQSISGHHSEVDQPSSKLLCEGCLRSMSRSGSFGSTQPPELRSPTLPHELPNPGLNGMFDPFSYMESQGPSQNISCNTVALRNHQKSPSELSELSVGSLCSPMDWKFPTLGNDALVPGMSQRLSHIPIVMQSLSPTSQTDHHKYMPLRPVNTALEGKSMLPGEDQTLGTNSSGRTDSTPGFISPEVGGIPPLETQFFPSQVPVQYGNNNLYASSPTSLLSLSAQDSSPSSTTSGPELQCNYPGCVFQPSGKNQEAYLKKHMKIHDKNEIPCDYCGNKFTRQDNLTCHIRKFHPDIYESVDKRRRDSSGSHQSSGQPKRKESRKEGR